MPPDTEMVLVVNVRQALEAPLTKKYALEQIKAALKGNEEAQKVLMALGLDPLKDIDTLIVANAGANGEKVTFILRGKFDTEKIHTTAQAVAKEVESRMTRKSSATGRRPARQWRPGQ